MKCLIVTNFFPSHGGGLEIVVGELASHLVADDAARVTDTAVEVEWIASSPAPEYDSPRLKCFGLRSWNWLEEKSGLPMPVWSPLELVSLVQRVRSAQLVFLNDCLYLSSWIVWFLAIILRKRIILLQHIDEIPGESSIARCVQFAMRTGYWIAAKLMLPWVDKIIFCSAKVDSYFKRRFPSLKHTTIILNGVATGEFKPDTRKKLAARPRILFAGRFVPRKGLDIMYYLARRFPGCDWVFAGRGIIDPDGWGLKNVVVMGQCDRQQMIDIYQSSDLLVLPSKGEGFPLVVQEAISCGLPVLVSAETASGDPEAKGFLMTADLNRKSFEVAINAFLARRAMELDPVIRGRRHDFAASHWNWTDTVAQYRHLFHELTNPGVF